MTEMLTDLSVRQIGRACSMTFAWRVQFILWQNRHALDDLAFELNLPGSMPRRVRDGANPPPPPPTYPAKPRMTVMKNFGDQRNYTGPVQLHGNSLGIFRDVFGWGIFGW